MLKRFISTIILFALLAVATVVFVCPMKTSAISMSVHPQSTCDPILSNGSTGATDMSCMTLPATFAKRLDSLIAPLISLLLILAIAVIAIVIVAPPLQFVQEYLYWKFYYYRHRSRTVIESMRLHKLRGWFAAALVAEFAFAHN